MIQSNYMKALVKTAKGEGFLEMREVPVPEISDTEVLIEVKAAGICGTDLHIYHDTFPYWPPVILGHEFSGIIAAKGKNITEWQIGDRVVGEPHTLACGKCWLCRTGNRQMCLNKRSPGWGINGCFAKYLKYPQPELLHAIPVDLSFEDAALVEPLANAVTDVLERGSLKTGDFVAVIGSGPIGLLAAMTAKAGGANQVMIIVKGGSEDLRLSTARKIKSIDYVSNVEQDDPIKVIMDLTNGRGADLVVEASGSPSGISLAFQAVRKLGRITSIGLTGKEKIEFPYDTGIFKAIELIFNLSTSYTSWDKAIRLLSSGKIDTQALITHRGGIEKWEEFFMDMEKEKAIKAILFP